MTSIFDENGKNIPCTVIEAGPCVVTQVRTKGVDGYEALQLVSMTKRETFHKSGFRSL
jgi:large subunit ribosomal protein L3